MNWVILYVHGKGGNASEAEQFQKNCPDYDIVGVNYDGDFPWDAQYQIAAEYDAFHKKYKHISLIANSIGAYFAMLALQKRRLEKALFISPVLDMERLILDMMQWANVTEQELCEKGEIFTDFGEALSWKYLCFVREHPIQWNVRTEILYAENDSLISHKTVDEFVKNHNAGLTVMENGEHWFHTEEQIAFLNDWISRAINS